MSKQRSFDWYKKIIRLLIYFFGLFIIAVGINLAIVSDLGVSPVSAFTVPLSTVTEMRLGLITDIVYICFVIIEIFLLGKNFRIKNLLQVPFSIVFGFFIDYTGMVLTTWIHADTYGMKLLLTFAGVLVCALGATIYIIMDVVPNPPEGLILAFCERFKKDFGKMKIAFDCLFIILGVTIGMIFAGRVIAIREGTVIAAIFTGAAISFFTRWLEPLLKKIVDEESTENGAVALNN